MSIVLVLSLLKCERTGQFLTIDKRELRHWIYFCLLSMLIVLLLSLFKCEKTGFVKVRIDVLDFISRLINSGKGAMAYYL